MQFLTAYQNQEIYTVADAAALQDTDYPEGSMVYLTADITTDALVFDGCYPNLNLNGHTLAAGGLEIRAAAGVYTTMSIENGTLAIGGRIYTDGDRLPTAGEGHVAVTLRDLQQGQVE